MTIASLLASAAAPDSTAAASGAILAILGVTAVLGLLLLIATWVIYSKAGKPGWANIIPIYSSIVHIQLVGRPLWWFVMLLIPGVNIYFSIVLTNDLSKSFGHGVGFTLGLIFLPIIFLPILAFGGSQYVGPVAARQPAYVG